MTGGSGALVAAQFTGVMGGRMQFPEAEDGGGEAAPAGTGAVPAQAMALARMETGHVPIVSRVAVVSNPALESAFLMRHNVI